MGARKTEGKGRLRTSTSAGRGACFALSACSMRTLTTVQIFARGYMSPAALLKLLREEARGRCHHHPSLARGRTYVHVTADDCP
jgi:hypothetical protein